MGSERWQKCNFTGFVEIKMIEDIWNDLTKLSFASTVVFFKEKLNKAETEKTFDERFMSFKSLAELNRLSFHPF